MPYVKKEFQFSTGSTALEEFYSDRLMLCGRGGGGEGGAVSRMTEEILLGRIQRSFCCVPTGCKRYADDPIRSDQPKDAVRVSCSNRSCTVGQWMHGDCFEDWKRLGAVYLASMGGCRRTWNEGADSFSWMQGKPVHNDDVMKVHRCICGNGFLQRDVRYEATRAAMSVLLRNQTQEHRDHHQHQTKNNYQRRRQDEKSINNNYSAVAVLLGPVHQSSGDGSLLPVTMFGDNPQPLRIRTLSFSSTGSSPTSSNATPPMSSPSRRADGGAVSSSSSLFTPPLSPITTSEAAAAATMTSGSGDACASGGGGGGASGNIFRHRKDLRAFRVLPRSVQNPYHIKVEDDGPHGNDKIRSFLMTSLTRSGIKETNCVVCHSTLPIFDEFPLIDGTFFLSPSRYADDISVVFDRRLLYLNAVCLGCLDGTRTRLLCRACLSPFDGSSLVFGTMYSYDIFAAMSCCQGRQICNGCHLPINDQTIKFFSDYSRLIRCHSCQKEDYHFVKPLRDAYIFKTM